MSPSTSSRLARLLRLYLDVVLAISLLACIILDLWLLASPLIMRSRNASMEAGIPVAIGTRSIRPVIPLAHIASTIPPLSPPLFFRSEVLLSGLLVLVLAQVWVYGMGIEREQALTI